MELDIEESGSGCCMTTGLEEEGGKFFVFGIGLGKRVDGVRIVVLSQVAN